MKETEAKLRISSVEETRSAILKLGAQFIKKSHQVDHYLSHPFRDFASTDEALRLRIDGTRYYVTYKGPKETSSVKKRLEYECEVYDPDVMGKIFSSLGFKIIADIQKEREVYRFGHYEINIDVVLGLGSFIEVEWRGDEIPDEKELISMANRLGAVGPPILKSYLEMSLQG